MPAKPRSSKTVVSPTESGPAQAALLDGMVTLIAVGTAVETEPDDAAGEIANVDAVGRCVSLLRGAAGALDGVKKLVFVGVFAGRHDDDWAGRPPRDLSRHAAE